MYRPIGIEEVPLGRLLPMWIDQIVTASSTLANATWRDVITDAFRSFSPNLRAKLRLIPYSAVLDMRNTKDGPNVILKDSDPQRAFQHIVLRWFRALGITTEAEGYPVVPMYRRQPLLNIDEVADLLVTEHIKWPALSDMQDGDPTLMEAIPVLLHFLSRVAQLKTQRARYVQQIRLMRDHVAWQLNMTGGFSDGYEQSLVLNYSDEKSAAGSSRYAPNSSTVSKPAECDDTRVFNTWARVRALVHPGPWTNFYAMHSNGVAQNLFATIMPHTPSFKFSFGELLTEGPFVRFVADEQVVVSWPVDGHDDTLQKQSVVTEPAMKGGVLTMGSSHLFLLPQNVASPSLSGALSPPMTFDLPSDLQLRVTGRGLDENLSNLLVSWASPSIGREVTSFEGFTVQDYLRDWAAVQTSGGANSIGRLDLSEFPFIDAAASGVTLAGDAQLLRLGSNSPVGLVTLATGALKIEVWYIDENATLASKLVDLEPFYVTRGRTLSRPVLREWFVPHVSALYQELPQGLEAFIMREMALKKVERIRSGTAIKVSVNYALMQFFMGVAPYESKEALQDLLKALASGATHKYEGPSYVEDKARIVSTADVPGASPTTGVANL